MDNLIENLNSDKNLKVYGGSLRLISVYDDNRYDRSDLDIVTRGMRNYIVNRLKEFDYDYVSGRVLGSKSYDAKFIIPKVGQLGGSPFDILRREKRSELDYFVVTPTQAAAFFLVKYSVENAIELMAELIETHPINFLKLKDFVGSEGFSDEFIDSLPELLKKQKSMTKKDHLKSKSHIGRLVY